MICSFYQVITIQSFPPEQRNINALKSRRESSTLNNLPLWFLVYLFEWIITLLLKCCSEFCLLLLANFFHWMFQFWLVTFICLISVPWLDCQSSGKFLVQLLVWVQILVSVNSCVYDFRICFQQMIRHILSECTFPKSQWKGVKKSKVNSEKTFDC